MVTLERRVQKTERAQKELAGQVQALALTQSIRQEYHQHYYGEPPIPSPHMRIEVVDEEVKEKRDEFLDSRETGGTA